MSRGYHVQETSIVDLSQKKCRESGSVRSSHQTVTDYVLRKRFPNADKPSSWQPV